jgi:hypothetical protein
MGDLLMKDYPEYQLSDYELIGYCLRLKPSKSILGRDGYIVAEKFAIIDDEGNPHIFDVGFESDGGTIPWWLRTIVPSGGRFLPAYLIHDAGCEDANKLGAYSIRYEYDKDIYKNLRGCGAARWRARPISSAVKRYGELLKATGELK